MSNSKLIKYKKLAHSSNYTKGRESKIKEITIHHMAGKLTSKQCGAIFQKKNRGASSNYGIGYNGDICLYVSESNTSWANANWKSNTRSVTIETSNSSTGGKWPVSEKSLNSLIKLVADIAKRNNLGKLVRGKNLTWHSMYSSTSCPGPYLKGKIDYIIKEANKINYPETKKEEFKIGDKVIPIKLIDINGKSLVQYDKTYIISSLNSKNATLKAVRGLKKITWATLPLSNIKKVK